jgi:predicted PurR-regulated permease PerM
MISTAPTTSRAAAKARARAAWADLRDRLATVTPATVARAVLGVVVIGLIATAVLGTWPALMPFVLGGLLAYAVLPVVDAMDRVLPRSLAAIVGMLGVLALIVAVLVAVVPPLTSALVVVASQVPSASEIDRQLEEALGGLPAETRDVVGPIALAVAATVKDALAGTSGNLDEIVTVAMRAALGVAGAVLGLIILPVWVLTLMSTDRRARLAVDRRLAGWLRADFWAILRMADRAAGTYLRGFVVVAFLVGLLTWLGLMASPRLGGPDFRGALALSVFAGAVQVVPELGPLLGFFPALLLLAVDPQRAAIYLAVYVVARFLGGGMLGGRVMEGGIRVHRAILIPGVVVLSQVGPLALLLSAPILAFGSDLVRYLHGRWSEPPRPAGLLPGEPAPKPVPAAATVAAARRVPPGYRGRVTTTATAASSTPR